MDPRVDPSDASDLVVNELYPVALKQARERVMGEAVLVPILAAGVLFLALTERARSGSAIQLFGWLVSAIAFLVRDVRWWRWLRTAKAREAYVRLQAGAVDGLDERQFARIYLPTVFGVASIYLIVLGHPWAGSPLLALAVLLAAGVIRFPRRPRRSLRTPSAS